MSGFAEPIPLSLYVHLPWCVRKCPYCDFNSHAAKGDLPETEYVAALLADLEAELPRVWGRRIESVFIGGGTPSLFSAAALGDLLDGLRARLPLRPDVEITLEANPGTFEQARFADYRGLGINRLSIGVQSFDDDALRRLGRIHGADEARRAAEIAHAAGFEDFNLDLMFGLPGQDLAAARRDIDAALALAPTHLSYYQLTLEPNTLFHHDPPALPDEDLIAAMQQAAQTRLAEAGFAQYEVSAYARPGMRCRHNLNYWRFGDYLGIGAGAHGKLTDPASGSVERHWKLRQPAQYMAAARAGDAAGGRDTVAPAELPFEFMLNALRLREGFDLALFEARTGLPRNCIEDTLNEALGRTLVEREGERVRPSALGWNFLNDLTALFLP
ncbi:radical SAM family heme chaperone HemW [Acidihalobacter prosperus]|uniref:Heme chaperone HemW n=1 Tax=Acidihalobacter prosperus TaxID=160660 RepID=A0A1A6C1D4_9GAMM|nr:radical SAM family heme chaperone HemW [Acidihalobacter prosperus]OBS08368.1 coproporphyrinogen III oxidase [Acidihalobacter prosperus]